MDDVNVRVVTASDRDDAVSSLASAFAADPILSWMTRSDTPPAGQLRLLFETIVDGELAKGAQTNYVAGAGAGASIWRDVGDSGPSAMEIVKSTPTYLRVFRSGLGRTLRAVSVVDRAQSQSASSLPILRRSAPGLPRQGSRSRVVDSDVARATKRVNRWFASLLHR